MQHGRNTAVRFPFSRDRRYWPIWIWADLSTIYLKGFSPLRTNREIRAWVRQLDLGVRQSIVLGTSDRRILEAVVSAPPELSGFAGHAALAGRIENRYFELTYPGELAEIETLDSVVAEAEAAIAVARNEMRSTIDLHQHDFDALLKPLETIRPWLLDDDRQVCEVGADGKPTYRAATETDVANGVRYKSFDEYKRAQGLATRHKGDDTHDEIPRGNKAPPQPESRNGAKAEPDSRRIGSAQGRFARASVGRLGGEFWRHVPHGHAEEAEMMRSDRRRRMADDHNKGPCDRSYRCDREEIILWREEISEVRHCAPAQRRSIVPGGLQSD
jgi:hypothetical protein